MHITNIHSSSFGMKFIKNNAYNEVKEYAQKVKDYDAFHRAVNNIESNNIDGSILIKHGIKDDKHFSTFTYNNRRIENVPYMDETYLDATLRAIKDLSFFGGRFRALTGLDLLHKGYK